MKSVGALRKTTSGIDCKATKEFFAFLKKKGKTPYLITHSTYYSIRFHHKGRYICVIAKTGKWNIEQSRGTRKWFTFNFKNKFWDYIEAWD